MVISSPAAVLWVLWRGVLQLPPLALGNRLHDANAKGATRSGRVGRNPCPPKRGKVRMLRAQQPAIGMGAEHANCLVRSAQ